MRQGLFIIFLLSTFNLLAQVNNRKLLAAQNVFNNLVDAYASNKSAPLLKFFSNKSQKIIAQYLPYPQPTIQIDEDLYDICMSFGSDSDNALAIVLSHEMAHYYNNHDWCSDYAFVLRNSSLGITLNKVSKESKIEKESIADSYGLFYASLAGYKPFGTFNKLLDKIYRQYRLPETMPGYPSKQERMEINRVQRERVESLVPVFEAGLIMQYLKHYEDAASCFDYLTKFYPSREMYNNYGVCKLFQALRYKPVTTINFIYPIEIDASSRIYSQNERGNEALTRENEFKELIQEAKIAFEKAISIDQHYIVSYINLACLYDIRGNYQAALGVVNEVENFTSLGHSDLKLIKAIALYHTKSVSQSEELLKSLSLSDSSIYDYNYQLLVKSSLFGDDFQSIERWKDEWVKETVVLSSDTCNTKYKLLNNATNSKSSFSSLNINEFLSVSRVMAENTSLLMIQTQNFRVIAHLTTYETLRTNFDSTRLKFIVNNGKCFSIKLPKLTWSITFKEVKNE